MQLLIPYAHVNDPRCAQAASSLQLPQLAQLLRAMTLVETVSGSAQDLSPPHEVLMARALGLTPSDGRIPWAALEQVRSGQRTDNAAHAWLTPAHWQIGIGHILMRDPKALELQEAESRALMQAMAPYFEQDGLALTYQRADRWLVSGEPLAELASASLDRVLDVDISPWMPTTPALRRLQNEMQMLLYTHVVNDERVARGQQAVNSFWIHGSGRYAGAAPATPGPIVADALRMAALQADWSQWTLAWQQIDQGACAHLLAELQAGRPASLVLCSERHALVFEKRPAGWGERLRRRFTTPSLQQYAPHL
jgi:hypothetical protein